MFDTDPDEFVFGNDYNNNTIPDFREDDMKLDTLYNLDRQGYHYFFKYEKDLPQYSEEDCRLYGILLGDGHITKKKGEAGVTLNTTTKLPTMKFVEGYLKNHGIHFWKTTHPNTGTPALRWMSTNVQFPFNRAMLYDSDGEKRFYPPFLHLPKEKLKAVFLGMMETDGTYRKGKEIYLELSSFQTIECIRYILLRMGVATSGYRRDRRGNVSNLVRGDKIITKKETMVLRIPKVGWICELLGRKDPSKTINFFEYDGRLWSRVIRNKVIAEPKTEFVVDLLMERKEDTDKEVTANFLTCIGSAHNGGKRPGAGTAHLPAWHIDFEKFLELRKATGPESARARDLFYAVWLSDEFMRRVKRDEEWTLFCPNKAKGLEKVWGIEFEMLYRFYEEKALQGKISHFRRVKARELWKSIILTQIETGMPFILLKDACNRKSNQKNLGTIRLSNLCTEILLYTDKDNIGSCILAAAALNSCVELFNPGPSQASSSTSRARYIFNFKKLEGIVTDLVRNLNRVIDRNFYPADVPQIKNSNFQTRPLGIGVHGLADVFAMMDLVWDSKEAKDLNIQIFETMYYAATKESINLAKIHGPYPAFAGSPASKGQFQFDMWDIEEFQRSAEKVPSSEITLDMLQNRKGPATNRYDWETLRKEMMKHGLRNSLLMALMPTASSAHILGNNESMEPYTQHTYTRSVLSGKFLIVNKHLVKDLQEIGLWNTKTVREVWSNQGSIADVTEEDLSGAVLSRLIFLKKKYRTVFEMSQKILLDMALDRGRYICQTQSFNCFMKNPSFPKLNAFHMYGWEKGAKTGMYYLRQPAIYDPINFSLNSINIPSNKGKNRNIVCDGDVCFACST